MTRKPPLKTLSNRADRIWAERVKVRGGGSCERCGRYEGIQSHHVVSRRIRRLRWNLRNGAAICSGCHWYAHQQPLAFAAWFQQHRPDDYLFLIDPENTKPIQRSRAEYEALLEDLKHPLSDTEAAA